MLFQRSVLVVSLVLAVASAANIKGGKRAPNLSRRLKKLEAPKQRTCDIAAKDDEVQFECETKSGSSKDSSSKDSSDAEATDPNAPQDRGIDIVPDGEIKDKIKYKVKTTKDGISVKLEYKNEVEMDLTETETKTKFELLFLELVEYVKAAGAVSDAFDWDQDEIVQTISLGNWMDISTVTDDAEGIVSYFTATTMSLGDSGGNALFNFTISRADQGETITANRMKIDIRILDFPWTRTDSYVALMSTLQSDKKVKVDYDKDAIVGKGQHALKPKDVVVPFEEDMESVFGYSTYGEYTWAKEAAATGVETPFNGTVMMARQGSSSESVVMVGEEANKNSTKKTSTIEVIATSPEVAEVENVQLIAYSFVGAAAHRASDIYWDPEAGIGYSGAGQHGLLVGLVGTAILALLSSIA